MKSFAVLAEDAKAVAKAPGVGPKLAGKIILSLRTFKLETAFEQSFKTRRISLALRMFMAAGGSYTGSDSPWLLLYGCL